MSKYFINKSILADYIQCNTPHGYLAMGRDVSLRGLWRVYRIISKDKIKFLGYARGSKPEPLQLYRSFLNNLKDMQLKLEKKR